jgi:prolipoprotein diacylglyceryl transferase
MLGYLPSPSSNGISIGPLRLHMYGFLIVAGVFAAVWLSDRRWRARGGEAGTFSAIALWGVPGGLIGARIYHVATDYELYTHHPLDALKIWQGGLGIWGGIAGGTLAAWIYVRRRDLDFPAIMDVVAPALPLAQAIGRWGNYFNQELFGRPTTLPWGLKIDAVNRPAAFAQSATFHPTFLYESLWDLAVVLLVLWIEKHVRLRTGYLFAVYVALYTFGRFFTEYMRIDFAHNILGLRINDWTSVIIFVVATALVLRKGLVRRGTEPRAPDEGVEDLAPQRDRVAVAASGAAVGPVATADGETLAEESIRPLSEDEGAPPAATSEPIEEEASPVAASADTAAIEPAATPEPVVAEPVAAPEPAATSEPGPAAPPAFAATPEPVTPEPVATSEPEPAAKPEPVVVDPAATPVAEPVAQPQPAEPEPEAAAEPAAPEPVEPAVAHREDAGPASQAEPEVGPPNEPPVSPG